DPPARLRYRSGVTQTQPHGLFGQPVQPWNSVPDEPADRTVVQRDRFLASLADSEFGTVLARVGIILQKYPETRDNDVSLAIRYWMEFEAEAVASCEPLSLDVLYDLQFMPTIVRCRQRIQND